VLLTTIAGKGKAIVDTNDESNVS